MIAFGKATEYHAAKGGVRLLTMAAAVEYAQKNIRVNALRPGPIDTPTTETHPDESKAGLKNATPMKRAASPDEVARAAIFLVSDDASSVTGTTLVVDGGSTAVSWQHGR